VISLNFKWILWSQWVSPTEDHWYFNGLVNRTNELHPCFVLVRVSIFYKPNHESLKINGYGLKTDFTVGTDWKKKVSCPSTIHPWLCICGCWLRSWLLVCDGFCTNREAGWGAGSREKMDLMTQSWHGDWCPVRCKLQIKTSKMMSKLQGSFQISWKHRKLI